MALGAYAPTHPAHIWTAETHKVMHPWPRLPCRAIATRIFDETDASEEHILTAATFRIGLDVAPRQNAGHREQSRTTNIQYIKLLLRYAIALCNK